MNFVRERAPSPESDLETIPNIEIYDISDNIWEIKTDGLLKLKQENSCFNSYVSEKKKINLKFKIKCHQLIL